MAYVLGKKVVTDTEEFDSFAYGLAMPVQKGNTGMFNQTFTSFDQARSNLINLLKTRRGERVNQPEFGSGLHDLLFEQMADEEFAVRIEETITESVNFWLPYISIREINVELTDEQKDRNQAVINLRFSVNNQFESEEVTFTVGN